MDAKAIRAIAQSGSDGVADVSERVAEALAQEVNYRVKEIVVEASKFAMHAKRSRLCAVDIDSALKLRGVEQTYGFQDGGSLKLVSAPKFPEVSFIQDRVVDLSAYVRNAQFPPIPLERGMHLHWLSVGGEKPAVPENMPLPKKRRHDVTDALADGVRNGDEKASTSSQRSTLRAFETNMQQPYRHVVSRELELYFSRATGAFLEGNWALLRPILRSMQRDPGLQPIVPYFSSFFAKQTTGGAVFEHLVTW